MNNSYITIIKEKRTVLSRKRVPLNQNECTADFRIGVPFEQNLQYEQKYIAVKNEKGYFKLFLSDIEYIETVKRKVLFHLRNGNQEDGYFKMRDLEERLEKYYFVRCHNGIIVNVDCIESLHDLTVTLYSGDKIYITCKLRSNGMPVPLLRNGYSIFNGTKYR